MNCSKRSAVLFSFFFWLRRENNCCQSFINNTVIYRWIPSNTPYCLSNYLALFKLKSLCMCMYFRNYVENAFASNAIHREIVPSEKLRPEMKIEYKINSPLRATSENWWTLKESDTSAEPFVFRSAFELMASMPSTNSQTLFPSQ